MNLRLQRTIVLSVIFLGSWLAARGASEGGLRNARVALRFDGRGLRSIEDVELRKMFQLAQDGFAITIDGKLIDSEHLAAPAVKHDAGSVTYTFRSRPYTIDVVYELKPDWRFATKQLLVKADDQRGFRVNRVTAISGKLVEAPQAAQVATSHWRRESKEKDYGVFFRYGGAGLMVLVQNPFLKVEHEAGSFALTYSPEMEWKTEYRAFPSDRAVLGTYALTGQKVPTYQVREWKLEDGKALVESPALDQAETDAFMHCVRAFVLEKRKTSTKINVAWTENDYQIDVATPEGRQEYKRIIDRAADLGLEHMVFGPANTALALEKDDTDSWHWEHILWLGLGQKIRRGEWDIASGAIPPSVQEMLDYARAKRVSLVAYVYPVLPFQQNRAWLVGPNKDAANIGNRAFQDFLINSLVAFAKRTGISGYAFDYAWLGLPEYSEYSQWWGWKRVVESLRAQLPALIMDGRQGYQQLGPWTWLAGSYPHPTSTDEQAESFTPFPDLHFDRVSADRERITAYRYRVNDFCPPELMPGFIGHQSERYDNAGQQVNGRYRVRDWDYLGWRYSLLSSIAVAGLQNVMSMIPARDPAEYQHFSAADMEFFRRWLKWTDDNRQYLLNTRFIMGQPALGKIDGSTAIVNDTGYIFLFNPNARRLTADFQLDASIGLSVMGDYLLTEICPESSRLIGEPAAGIWKYGDRVSVALDGASVRVFKLAPAPKSRTQPLVFNAPGQARLQADKLVLDGVGGEAGTSEQVMVLLPGNGRIAELTVNGAKHDFTQSGPVITVPVRFAGAAFRHMQQVGQYDPAFAGGEFTARFAVPQRIFDQLKQRQQDWPIPWTADDLKTTWLAPERLLLFIQVAEPKDDMPMPKLEVDGKPVEVSAAYSSVRRNAGSIVGYYADVSNLEPGREYQVRLTLPALRAGQFQGVFFENVEPEYTQRLGGK